MKLLEVKNLIDLTITPLDFDFAPAGKRGKLIICSKKKGRIAAGRQNMRRNSAADIHSSNTTVPTDTHENSSH